MCLKTYDIYVVDRIEGSFAVCENKKTKKILNIPLSILPTNIHESDILKYINGEYVVDYSLTNSTHESILDRFNNLKE